MRLNAQNLSYNLSRPSLKLAVSLRGYISVSNWMGNADDITGFIVDSTALVHRGHKCDARGITTPRLLTFGSRGRPRVLHA